MVQDRLDNPTTLIELVVALTTPGTRLNKIAQFDDEANYVEVLIRQWLNEREGKNIWEQKQAEREQFFEGLVKKVKRDEAENAAVAEQQAERSQECVERIIQLEAERTTQLVAAMNTEIQTHEDNIKKIDEEVKEMEQAMVALGTNIEERREVEHKALEEKITSGAVVIMDGEKAISPEEAKEKLAAIPPRPPMHELLNKPDLMKALFNHAVENKISNAHMAENVTKKAEGLCAELNACAGLCKDKNDKSEEMDPKKMLKFLRDQKQAKSKSINTHIAQAAKHNFKENIKDVTNMMDIMQKKYQAVQTLEGEKKAVATLKEAVNILEKPVLEKVLPEQTITVLNNEMDKQTERPRLKR